MDKIIEASNYIKKNIGNFKPDIGIVLGSGLGALPDDYDCIKITYSDIPNFQKPSIEGHKGQLCFCEAEGKKLVMMQGRYHFYEGYSMEQITFPIKVLKLLGIKTLILTNAAGAVNKKTSVGDIMLITDHINLMGSNPLIGKNIDEFGVRFPDMSEIYKIELRNKVKKASQMAGVEIKEGVYLAMPGPSYETPAEVKMANIIGADVIGMSTAPEAVVANHCGMDIIGLSCITNYAAGVSDKKLSHDEVIETANKVKLKFKTLIKAVIKEL